MSSIHNLRLRDWSRYPGGRFEKLGPYSGEEYRKLFIEPQMAAGNTVRIDLNGIFTIGWSFFDEAFGHYLPVMGEELWRSRFIFVCDDDPDVPELIEHVIQQRLGQRGKHNS